MMYSRPGEDHTDPEWKLLGRIIRVVNAANELRPLLVERPLSTSEDEHRSREWKRLGSALEGAYVSWKRERGERRYKDLNAATAACAKFLGELRAS